MRAINENAFSMLLEDEKMALGLQIGMQKSSWESGEILGRSHYKYLEIKYRAEKFLRLFTEYLGYYRDVLPTFLEGQAYVIQYFSLCISKRMKAYHALEEINKQPKKITKSQLNDRIIEVIEHWQKTQDNVHHLMALHLVLEFDRWNNFRILPKEIQEPSAYKRRLKNAYKKHLKVLIHIPNISITKIISLYELKRGKKSFLYWPFLNNQGTYSIIRVKTSKGSLDCFNALCLYLFRDQGTAEEYIVAGYNYLTKVDRDCKDGLDFWPIYRELIKKAENYENIQNIIPQRKYLDTALKNLQFI